ncbi:MAG: DUF3662 domain-containing protein [Anaerolineales bacterium]|nr:DUF3662 domain-containing protein [Anaerolineales bacterium]
MPTPPQSRLAALEARMEALVEGTLARLFPGRIEPIDLQRHLVRTLEDTAAQGAPAVSYTIRLHRDDVAHLVRDNPNLTDTLAALLVETARQLHVTLPSPPDVTLLPDEHLRPRSLIVTGDAVRLGATATGSVPAQAQLGVAAGGLPPAFLILDGDRTVPLRRAVISLGRRLDNDVILEHSSVSRAHAQLRLRFGRYVVYDLGSSGGTFVNDQRVQECLLKPGDVLRLAGVSLIYGEDQSVRTHAPAEPSRGKRDVDNGADRTRPIF